MPPFQDLVHYLQGVIETTYPNETISIPRDIVNGVQRLTPLPESADIDSLVELFDGLYEGSCSRLDVSSFQCILHVLLGGEWGLAQERGLYLFLSRIKQLTNESRNMGQSTTVSPSRQLKSAIGQKTLQLCLTHFTDVDGPGIPRRWSGIFLLELLRYSDENRELLVSAPEETRRGIGKIVLSGSDSVLRLIGANIMREMISTQSDLKIFWPIGSNKNLVTTFPVGQQVDSRWIENFYSFISWIDREVRQDKAEREYVGVAPSTISDNLSCLAFDSSLVVVTPHGITLVHPGTSDTTIEFLDIMFENIERYNYQRERPLAVDLELSQHDRGNYVKDGSIMKAERLSLLFESEEQVKEFLIAIECKEPRLQSSQEASEKKRHISAAYVALAGSSSPTGISLAVGLDNTTQREKQPSRISRVSSFAMVSLPSQQEVVARSSVLLEAHLSPGNDGVVVRASDNPIAVGECPELIESSSISETRPEPPKTGTSGNGYESPIRDVQDVPTLTEAENQPTAMHSQETQREDRDVDVGDKTMVSTQIEESKGSSSMRLQQNEGLEALRGLPSPIQETPQPSSQDSNIPLRKTSSPSPDQSLGDCLHQIGNNDISSVMESGVGSVEISDSQPSRTNSNEPQLEDKMTSVDSFAPREIQTRANVMDTPIIPAELGSASHLKRPRQKVIEAGVRKITVDWDQDLRPSPIEKDLSSNKKPKTSGSKVPIPTKVKKLPNSKADRQRKSVPRTPKVETPETMRKPKAVKKRQPTKTLTSSRQLRTAAGKAKEKIAKAKYDESENFDIDDPIESTSPEPSPIETPMNKPELPKKLPTTGTADILSRPDLDSVSNKHDPIILDTTHLDDDVAAPQPSGKSPIEPAPKESLILETSLQDLDSTLLRCLSPLPIFQGADSHSHPVAQCTVTDGVSSPKESASLEPFDDVRSGCTSERTSPVPMETDSNRKQTFAEKLSLALVGTGILSVDDVKSSEGSISRIEESCLSPDVGLADTTLLCRRENVSRVSQNVAEFMSRQVKAGDLPTETGDNVSATIAATQDLEKRITSMADNFHSVKGAHFPDTPRLPVETNTTRYPNTSRVDNGRCGTRPVASVEPTTRVEDIDTPMKRYQLSQQSAKSALVDDRVHRKTQVVSFDIDGPRNQGLSSTKKSSTRPSKPITPILKEPRNSMVPKKKADTEVKEQPQPDEEPSFAPDAKRQMIQPVEGPGTITDEDPDTVDALFKSEILAQSRAPQLFGSQQSMVDVNGSPHLVARVSREPRMLARAQTKEITGNGRTQQSEKQPRVMELKNRYPKDKDTSQNQPSEEGMIVDEGGSVSLVSNSEREQKEKSITREEKRPRDSRSRGFLFPVPAAPVEAPVAEQKTKEPVNPLKGGLKRSHFIDSPRSQTKTTDHSFDTDSEAETEIEYHDSGSLSSYSTDSTSSKLSETLTQPDVDADIELRNALRSTQKTTLDILLDTSKRLVRHLVDEQTAIVDLVTIYQNGCEKILEQLQKAHDASLEGRGRQMQPLRKRPIGADEGANSRLKTGREKVQKLHSTKKLLSAVRKRKDLISGLDDVLNGYDVETG